MALKLLTEDTILLIMDIQDKLINTISERDLILWNINRLISASKILCVNRIYTEQNPIKLGARSEELILDESPNIIEKMSFSCFGSKQFQDLMQKSDTKNVILSGVETHICIQQTAIDLINHGFNVVIANDAVSSRNILDHETSLRRMGQSSIVISSCESIIFELCGTSDRKEFKAISNLVKAKRK